jgi:hypothetical protein
LFDRYLYPMVLVAAILLLHRRAAAIRGVLHLGRSHAPSHGAFAWLVASAFIIAANLRLRCRTVPEGDAAVGLATTPRPSTRYEWSASTRSGRERH